MDIFAMHTICERLIKCLIWRNCLHLFTHLQLYAEQDEMLSGEFIRYQGVLYAFQLH